MAGTSNSSSDELTEDDLYFSALRIEDEIFPISDQKYVEELQLQEAQFASASIVLPRNPGSHDKGIQIEKYEKDESSHQSANTSFCMICMDVKPASEMFSNRTCTHLFCSECISKHVSVKIQENISMVKCPDTECKGTIEPDLCRSILPQEVLGRWEDALCEALVLGSEKFYCPFKDCSAMMIDDGSDGVVISSECPYCRRLFCAQCKVAWHGDLNCDEFQNMKNSDSYREDKMVMELAKSKKWRKCPKCKFIVEKKNGCLHITCRCGCQFCYGCGSLWTQTHRCSA